MKKAIHILWIFLFLPYTGLVAQNAPISTIGTLSTIGSTAVISISAKNFSNIESCDLALKYDSTIALATAVTTGPMLGGNMNSNLSVPGQILIGWYTYPVISLTGDPVLFNISFEKVDTGTTQVSFYHDSQSCVFFDGNFQPLNDLPVSDYYINGSLTFRPPVAPAIIAPVLHGNTGGNIDVPVKVAGFTDIGKFTLTLSYSSSNLIYKSFFSNAGFPGLTINGTIPGRILVTGLDTTGVSGITLPDSTILFTLHFIISGGSSPLNWADTGSSCEYFGPPPAYDSLYDLPKTLHYYNGSVTGAAPFGIPIPGDEPYFLLKSSPNPSSGNATLTWFLPEKGKVTIDIINTTGEKITTLKNEPEKEGNHSLNISSYNIRPGIYIVRMIVETSNRILSGSIKIICIE